jgi:hypothetical protein
MRGSYLVDGASLMMKVKKLQSLRVLGKSSSHECQTYIYRWMLLR